MTASRGDNQLSTTVFILLLLSAVGFKATEGHRVNICKTRNCNSPCIKQLKTRVEKAETGLDLAEDARTAMQTKLDTVSGDLAGLRTSFDRLKALVEFGEDDCASSPCENGASCIDGVNTYTCLCAAGFTGANCATDIDDCASSPCETGRSCIDGVNTHTCLCAAGFTGVNCVTDIDDCASSPCENGGTCIDGVNTYTCQCADGYIDVNCSTAVCLTGPEANAQFRTCFEKYNTPGLAEVVTTNNRTKKLVLDVLEQFCGTTMPSTHSCFLETISRCDEAERARLSRLLTNTRFACDNGTIHSDWREVVNALPDTDIASVGTVANCDSVDLTGCEPDMEQSLTVTPEEWAAKIQSQLSLALSCVINRYYNLNKYCTPWRGYAGFILARLLGYPPVFGTHVELPRSLKQLIIEYNGRGG